MKRFTLTLILSLALAAPVAAQVQAPSVWGHFRVVDASKLGKTGLMVSQLPEYLDNLQVQGWVIFSVTPLPCAPTCTAGSGFGFITFAGLYYDIIAYRASSVQVATPTLPTAATPTTEPAAPITPLPLPVCVNTGGAPGKDWVLSQGAWVPADHPLAKVGVCRVGGTE
jgi:hypothetical protein